MKAKEKRKNRGYKCAEKPYRKAMARAKKEKISLATQIEQVIIAYGLGYTIQIFDQNSIDKVTDVVTKIEKYKQENP